MSEQKSMEVSEMLWIASKAVAKTWDFEELKYGDDLYGREQYADDVWKYVEECMTIGTAAFYEKYQNHKLYYA